MACAQIPSCSLPDAFIPLLQGNIIGIDSVLLPPSAAAVRNPPLWDPSPAATAAANYTTLAVGYLRLALCC